MPNTEEPRVTIKFDEDREVRDHEGRVEASYRAGQVKEFSRSSAMHWLSRGVAHIHGESAEPAAEPTPEPRPEGAALMAAIAVAIGDLDTAADFTRDGLPKVEVLERVLGYGISADERDAAWAHINAG